MALILNIETATTVCSVSLAKDGHLLALKEQDGDYSHAENLTVFIEDVVKQANIKLSAIDAVAVSKGPGSYTGLRIGVSTAKGLCYALNKPLIAVDTLQYLSLTLSSHSEQYYSNRSGGIYEGGEEQNVVFFCPMLDARRMEVYCGIYNTENEVVKPVSAEIIDKNSFSDLLQNHLIYFFGNGAIKCKAVLSHNKNAVFIDNVNPSAAKMITLSENAFNNGAFEDVAYFEPFYLKDFIAGKKKAH